MEINLFMTAIGGDVASAALRCIRRHYRCKKIVGCDVQKYNQGIMYVDLFFEAPPYVKEKEYSEFIIKICTDQNITHFWPMTEHEIEWADKHRKLFEEMGVKPIITNSQIIDIAGSKYRTAKKMKEMGFHAPETLFIDSSVSKKEIVDKIGFPMILKMDNGCGSKGIRVVHNANMWDDINLSHYFGYVAQQYIGTEENEYTIGIFSDGMKTESIIFKRYLGYGGLSRKVITVENQNIKDEMCRLACKLGLKGAINVQMRWEGDLYYIFEINARISSTVGFRDMLGFCDAVWWLKISNNENCTMDYKIQPGKIGIKVLEEQIL